jgi:hypothetical protein
MARVNNSHNYITRTASEMRMAMPDIPPDPRSVTLSLPPEQYWTLHHVLLDRIEQEATAEDPASIDPPSIEVFQAFERLDAGETSFTIVQLKAIQTILAEYHHSPVWEIERSQLEQLLHHVSKPIEQHQTTLLPD